MFVSRPTIDSLISRVDSLREQEPILIRARALFSQLLSKPEGRALQAPEESKMVTCIEMACSLEEFSLDDAHRNQLCSLQTLNLVSYRKCLSAVCRLLGGVGIKQLVSLFQWEQSLVIPLFQDANVHGIPHAPAAVIQAILGLKQARPGCARVAHAACLTEAEVRTAWDLIKQSCAARLESMKSEVNNLPMTKRPKKHAEKRVIEVEPEPEVSVSPSVPLARFTHSMRPACGPRETSGYQTYLKWILE